jgi:hypothetical protein
MSVGRWGNEEDLSRKGAKAQRQTREARQRFATLRLCARNISEVK